MFAQTHSNHLGCVGLYSALLRMMHNDQMQKMYSSRGAERERHAEEASKTRQLMRWTDLVQAVDRAGLSQAR